MAALAATILSACGVGASAPPATNGDGDRRPDHEPTLRDVVPAWNATEASLRTLEMDAATLRVLRRA